MKIGNWGSLLAKACLKYPAGTQGRWEIIANYIGSRSEAEVIAKAKELATTEAKPDDAFAQYSAHKKTAPEN